MPGKPNFFLVGAPKCGTTSYFHYLSLHPNLFAPSIKEPYFFCDDFEILKGGQTLDDYLDLFSEAGSAHHAIGEASVTYMYSTVAMQNIFEFDPTSRIIAMIRNPCQLVYSLHSHLLYLMEEEEADFEVAWSLQDDRLQGTNVPKKCQEPFFLQYREVGLHDRVPRPATVRTRGVPGPQRQQGPQEPDNRPSDQGQERSRFVISDRDRKKGVGPARGRSPGKAAGVEQGRCTPFSLVARNA
jgi:hypothetical protein